MIIRRADLRSSDWIPQTSDVAQHAAELERSISLSYTIKRLYFQSTFSELFHGVIQEYRIVGLSSAGVPGFSNERLGKLMTALHGLNVEVQKSFHGE
jgi:hypothetical protein